MSEPFIGEIKMFAGNFAPRSFALCDGQLLAISQNNALFSLLGTIYGGDGRTTFGLPELRGRVPIHTGTGPGLSPRNLGSKAGSERATVAVAQLPAHTHTMQGSTDLGGDTSPAGNVPATGSGANLYKQSPPTGEIVTMDADAVVPQSSGNQAHNNIMPFLCINFIIALSGIFPSRN
ncbi:MAG: tail fiber protein [Gammaproteobacteria bacterium]|nr:tail fiber protein [Gammaproteobacteria bacterium]